MKFTSQMCNQYFFFSRGYVPNRTQVSPGLCWQHSQGYTKAKAVHDCSKSFLEKRASSSGCCSKAAHAGQKNGGRCRDYSSTTGSNQILPKEWLLHPGQNTTAKWFKTTAISLCCHSDNDKSRIQRAGETSPLLTLITWVETLFQIRSHSSAPGTGYLNVPFKG